MQMLSVLMVAMLLSLGGAVVAYCDNDMLAVVQDESSMERTIKAYLVDVHKLIVDEKISKDDANDMYLELPFKGDPMPKFRMTIDSQSLNTDNDTKKVIERGVLFNLYTNIKVPEAKRAGALQVINDYNRRKAFCSVYIDTDGEVICSWILNVLEQGLATEYVYDTVARLQNIWKAVYPDLKAELDK
jgi:hypothetical protein